MTGNAIEVRGLGKRYVLGEHAGSATTLREALTGTARRLARRGSGGTSNELWSLRDVSFEVERGHALGVIGRNGAGKSTLLRVLTRITEPTEGVARTRGRVGSLLEVGTGFHPELTGRENVFLNGALLGMARREIATRFDEIVEFAGVARFIDTPVKRYSSGMYLRLAFAVAAHLDADIMIVDEVLAVGDAEFQRKCLGKMGDLERGGRTVLFVSHNLDAIQRLCSTSLWLEHGEVRAIGPSAEVVDDYLSTGLAPTTRRGYSSASTQVTLADVRLLDAEGKPTVELRRDQPVTVEVRFRVCEPVLDLDVSLFVENLRGVRVLDEAWSGRSAERHGAPGEYVARITLPPVLAVGDYLAGIWIGTVYETFVHEPEALHFRLDGPTLGRSDRLLQLELPWDVSVR